MDEVSNPYSPGAGRRPPQLAGRDGDLAAFDALLARLERGRGERGIVMTGLRGVGKTVLLGECRDRAERRGWVVAKVEAGTGRPFPVVMSQALRASLRSATGRHEPGALRRALAAFKRFSLGVSPDGSLSLGIDVDAAPGATTGDLELDLTELVLELGGTATELGIGVLLLIDEMQDLAKGDLRAVCGASHEASQRTLPVAVVGAGLPNLPAVLTEAKTYAERLFAYRHVGALAPADAAQALTVPAAREDVGWDDDAVALTVDAAGGYPYFLQVFGADIWNHAPGSPITAVDARTGVEIARHDLDAGLYGARWDRATPNERRYLTAVATSGGDRPVASAEVAAALGRRRQSDVSPVRDQLIKKGLLYAPERGLVAFTVPGMAAYIARRAVE